MNFQQFLAVKWIVKFNMRTFSKKSLNSSFRKKTTPISEINVTPFVDVMLVLLVIFMVTAPLLTVGVQIDLPKTHSSVIEGSDEPLAVSIDSGGVIFLQDTEVDIGSLVPRLNLITENNKDIRIFVRGDKSVNYGRVMSVMGRINAAGYAKVAMVALREDNSKQINKGSR